jgi:hypothetical protein
MGTDTRARSGDRIIVDKTTAAKRWEIIAYPYRSQAAGETQTTEEVIYAHRLVGMPGERLEIFGGEVFIDEEILRKGPAEVHEGWVRVSDTQFIAKETHELAHQ